MKRFDGSKTSQTTSWEAFNFLNEMLGILCYVEYQLMCIILVHFTFISGSGEEHGGVLFVLLFLNVDNLGP